MESWLASQRPQLRIDTQVRHRVRALFVRVLELCEGVLNIAQRLVHFAQLKRRDVMPVLLLFQQFVKKSLGLHCFTR